MVVVFTAEKKVALLGGNSNSLRKTTLGKAREHILSRQMSSVSSSGTFVNREDTSKEYIISLSWLYFLAQSTKLKESLRVYWSVPGRDWLGTRDKPKNVCVGG